MNRYPFRKSSPLASASTDISRIFAKQADGRDKWPSCLLCSSKSSVQLSLVVHFRVTSWISYFSSVMFSNRMREWQEKQFRRLSRGHHHHRNRQSLKVYTEMCFKWVFVLDILFFNSSTRAESHSCANVLCILSIYVVDMPELWLNLFRYLSFQNDIYLQTNTERIDNAVLFKYIKAILPGMILLLSYGTQTMWGLHLMPYNTSDHYHYETSLKKTLMVLMYYLGGIIGIFVGAALIESIQKNSIYVSNRMFV